MPTVAALCVVIDFPSLYCRVTEAIVVIKERVATLVAL